MPTMPLFHKIKLFSNYLFDLKIKEIYNILFWVYPLWWNHHLSTFLLNRFFPKIGIDLFPPFLEIEPTTVCNFKCVCCEHTYWDEPQKNMTFEQFKKIFDDFNKPKWIGLTGIGSSYLNKDFLKMVAYAKSKGTIVELMDHFAHFKDEKQIEELIKIEPDFQFVSTYGASKESFEKVCIGSDYSIIEENIRSFVKIKKLLKKKFPILSFHYIITKESKNELLGFLEFVHSLDTEIAEVLVTPMLHDFEKAKRYSVKLESEYIDKIKKRAKELNVPITINFLAYKEAKKLSKKPPINFCKEYIMPFIFVNGDVTPCCGQNEANAREWQKKMSFGNTLEKPFRKIWYSPQYIKLRKLIRENKCPKECALCPAYEKC